jgi:acetyl esterase/lipase
MTKRAAVQPAHGNSRHTSFFSDLVWWTLSVWNTSPGHSGFPAYIQYLILGESFFRRAILNMHSSTDGDSLSQGQEHEQADVMQWTPAQPPSNDMAPGPADQTPAGTGPLPGPPPEPTTNKSLGGSLNIPWNPRDPRTSSTQSLASSTDPRGPKRKLLIIYIHGYKGSTTSFRSFPAHVHNLLKILLAETHVVHTKIYPRYKTYKSISVACENFSQWLAPHESPTTDVVLVGHSMGGLLAAEVALLVCTHFIMPPFQEE